MLFGNPLTDFVVTTSQTRRGRTDDSAASKGGLKGELGEEASFLFYSLSILSLPQFFFPGLPFPRAFVLTLCKLRENRIS